MLKLGFEEQVSAISKQIRGDARRCLVSASFGGGVREKSDEWVPEPKCVVRVGVIDIGKGGGGMEDGSPASGGKAKIVESVVDNGDNDGERDSKSFSLLVGKSTKSTREDTDSDRKVVDAASYNDQVGEESSSPPPPFPASPEKIKKNSFGLAKIPSHVAQVVHVCSSHKKPKKLLGILKKLTEAEEKSGRGRNPGQVSA